MMMTTGMYKAKNCSSVREVRICFEWIIWDWKSFPGLLCVSVETHERLQWLSKLDFIFHTVPHNWWHYKPPPPPGFLYLCSRQTANVKSKNGSSAQNNQRYMKYIKLRLRGRVRKAFFLTVQFCCCSGCFVCILTSISL